MTIIERIENTARSLEKAVHGLVNFDGTVGPALSLTDAEKSALESRLPEFLSERIDGLYNETALLEKGAGHFLNRISFTLRYRPVLWGDNVQAAVGQLDEDFRNINLTGSLAVHFINSASTDSRHGRAADGIHRYQGEASRILTALQSGPLSQEEVAPFYKDYPSPDDPRQAYAQETRSLSDIFAAAAQMEVDRIDRSIACAEFFFRSFIPAFADPAAILRTNAVEVLRQATPCEPRAQIMLNMAKLYATQALEFGQSIAPAARGPG